MNSVVKPTASNQPVVTNHVAQSDLKIALQSALAAALCLGLPVALFFWLFTVQRSAASVPIDRLVTFLLEYDVPPLMLPRIGALGWGLFLAKISGYRQWWWLSLATTAGVWLGNFFFYDGLLSERVAVLTPNGFSPHVRFGVIFAIAVLSVTVSVGLLLGLTLMNWKASLMLAINPGVAATLAAVLTLMMLDGLGVRVGSGNAAMPKATAAATMAAALAGGAALGVMFSRYVRTGSSHSQSKTSPP